MSAIIKISKKIKMVIFYHKMPAYSRNFKFVVLSPIHQLLTVIFKHWTISNNHNLKPVVFGLQMPVVLSTLRRVRMLQAISRLAALVVGSMAAVAAQETSLNCV